MKGGFKAVPFVLLSSEEKAAAPAAAPAAPAAAPAAAAPAAPKGDKPKGDKKKKEEGGMAFVTDFLMGGVSAAVSKTIAAPIERVKLLIQNQDEMLKSGRLQTRYTGIGDCFSRVMAEEGTMSLWRGNIANVLRYFPTQACSALVRGRGFDNNLVGYRAGAELRVQGPLQAHVQQVEGEGRLLGVVRRQSGTCPSSELLRSVAHVAQASGGLAGASSLAFVYSLDYARTRLAADSKSSKKGGGERQFNGLFDVYKKTLATDGVVGLYRGFVISCVGIIVYRGLYFGMFDSLKPLILTGPLEGSFMATFMLGWCVPPLPPPRPPAECIAAGASPLVPASRRTRLTPSAVA